MTENLRIVVEIDAELKEIIPDFMDLTRKDVESLRDALAHGDTAQLARLGHSLKGAGASYGFNDISRIGIEIEKKAKAGTIDVGGLIEELADHLERIEIVYK
jgi:HPt (histidine-containing phosphotransfer) domain-containing protein